MDKISKDIKRKNATEFWESLIRLIEAVLALFVFLLSVYLLVVQKDMVAGMLFLVASFCVRFSSRLDYLQSGVNEIIEELKSRYT